MNTRSPDDLSLEQLENDFWGAPSFDSGLVRDVHRVRTLPLRDLTTGDLRLTILQRVGLAHLVPRALIALEQDPLDDGDRYPGALLMALLNGPEDSFWRERRELEMRLPAILSSALGQLSDVESTPLEPSSELWRELQSHFHEALERLSRPRE